MKSTLKSSFLFLVLPVFLILGFFIISQMGMAIRPSTTYSKASDHSIDITESQGTNSPKLLDFFASQVKKINYSPADFSAVFNQGYRTEGLYQKVPGSAHNKKFAWSSVDDKVGKNVYVTSKATVYYQDANNKISQADFYQIRIGKINSEKFWINSEALTKA